MERITAAAVVHRDKVASLPPPSRHGDVIYRLARKFPNDTIAGEQGFVTSTGRFVDRRAAFDIALAAGQYKPTPGSTPGMLFSEDVW